MKVLIVDDNKQVRALVRDYLPATVEEVYECGDGAKALALYQEFLPDWVLLDWQMPGVDGITALRSILRAYPAAQVCLVTAFNDDEIRREALAAGALGYILKDSLDELEAVFSE